MFHWNTESSTTINDRNSGHLAVNFREDTELNIHKQRQKLGEQRGRKRYPILVIVCILVFLTFNILVIRRTNDKDNTDEAAIVIPKAADDQYVPNIEFSQLSKTKRCATYQRQSLCYDIYPSAFSLERHQAQLQIGEMEDSSCEQGEVCLDLVTQFSIDRLFRLKSLIYAEIPAMIRKLGPNSKHKVTMTAVIYTQDLKKDWDIINREVYRNARVCNGGWCHQHLHIHFVHSQEFFPYPINLLRNVGFLYSTGNWLVLYDGDFIPSENLLQQTELILQQINDRKREQQLILVVPVFEFDDHNINSNCRADVARSQGTSCSNGIPTTKKDLLRLWSQKIVEPFHYSYWPQGQRSSNYEQWKVVNEETLTIEPLKLERKYEPYVIFHRTSLQKDSSDGKLCDERFFNRDSNKVICFDRLRLMPKMQLKVMSNSFMIHFFEERKSKNNAMHLPKMEKAQQIYDIALRALERSKRSNL